jgi:molybdate transport system substrate-binding protein
MSLRNTWSMTVAIGGALLLCTVQTSDATETSILSTNALRSVITDLAPTFESRTKLKTSLTFAPPFDVAKRINAGEPFDLAITLPNAFDEMVKAKAIVEATRSVVGRFGVGVAVRAGAAKPDVSTVDAFKRALLGAKSVSYSTEGVSGKHLLGVFEKYGIADAMKAKLRPSTTPEALAAIAKGEIEMGLHVMPTILASQGVSLVGPIPTESQIFVEMIAGVVSKSTRQREAREFLAMLNAPETDGVLKTRGMERKPK